MHENLQEIWIFCFLIGLFLRKRSIAIWSSIVVCVSWHNAFQLTWVFSQNCCSFWCLKKLCGLHYDCPKHLLVQSHLSDQLGWLCLWTSCTRKPLPGALSSPPFCPPNWFLQPFPGHGVAEWSSNLTPFHQMLQHLFNFCTPLLWSQFLSIDWCASFFQSLC